MFNDLKTKITPAFNVFFMWAKKNNSERKLYQFIRMQIIYMRHTLEYDYIAIDIKLCFLSGKKTIIMTIHYIKFVETS